MLTDPSVPFLMLISGFLGGRGGGEGDRRRRRRGGDGGGADSVEEVEVPSVVVPDGVGEGVPNEAGEVGDGVLVGGGAGREARGVGGGGGGGGGGG